MSETAVFTPAKRAGMIFHLGTLAALAGAAGYGLWMAGQAEIGLTFLLSLLPALVGVASFPALAYRVYALSNANYTIQREGLCLRWGLRQEDIPIHTVIWVRSSSDFTGQLPQPLPRWPGAVLGVRDLPDGRKVEFLADRSQNLVLIATRSIVYAISPARPEEFLRAYVRFAELGAVVSLPAQSLYPTFLLARFWADRVARGLMFGGVSTVFLLWLWVVLAVPTRATIPWYLDASNQPAEFVPAVRLLLLPTLALFVYVFDLVLGFFFFRRSEYKALAYLFWFAGIVAVGLFGGGVFFILNF